MHHASCIMQPGQQNPAFIEFNQLSKSGFCATGDKNSILFVKGQLLYAQDHAGFPAVSEKTLFLR
jgi:hypothetical protein